MEIINTGNKQNLLSIIIDGEKGEFILYSFIHSFGLLFY